MDSFIIMLKNVMLFVALAVPGYILVKTKLLKSEQSSGLSSLLTFVGVPFLVFYSTISSISFHKKLFGLLLTAAVLFIAFLLVLFFLSKLIVKKSEDEKKRGMIRFCTVFANNGFLGIPLSVAVFGESSPVVTALIVMNVLNNIMLYTLGAYLVSGDKSTMSLKKAFLNPVLIAFLLAVLCNLLDAVSFLPELATYSKHFNNTVTPIAMTVLGMKLGDVKLSALFTSWNVYYVSFLKLVASPVLVVGGLLVLQLFVPTVDDSMILATFIAFAMPTASLSSLFADHYGGDTENAVTFTLGSTVLSVATIPLLYWALTALL